MRILLWIIGGFVGGALVAIGLCVAAGYLYAIPQSEGAYAMQVAFLWTPLGAVVGATVGLIVGLNRSPR